MSRTKMFMVFALSTTLLFAKDKAFAIRQAPVFNGPSKQSGRMLFTPTAKKPLTLDLNDEYQIISTQGEWTCVDIFGKRGWIESKNLSKELPSKTLKGISAERLRAFNEIESSNNTSYLYGSATQVGQTLSIRVREPFNRLSKDEREGYVKQLFKVWMGMGAVRHIPEKAQDYSIEIHHLDSGRTIATWNTLLGYREK